MSPRQHQPHHLHLVHTAPDPRLPTPQQTNADRQWLAMRGAWRDGQAVGEREGYVAGWRWGLVCGVCAAIAGGLACLAVLSLLRMLALLP